jgi:DNA polymerase III sliding clamp (beta) subunit (PCNA family)
MTNLTIEKASLAQALGIVTRAVTSRPTLAALGTVLLKSEDVVGYYSGSRLIVLVGGASGW